MLIVMVKVMRKKNGFKKKIYIYQCYYPHTLRGSMVWRMQDSFIYVFNFVPEPSFFQTFCVSFWFSTFIKMPLSETVEKLK